MSDTLILFYSGFSRNCKNLRDIIPDAVMEYIYPICIDPPDVRNLVRNQISSVPCIIRAVRTDNSYIMLEKHEGEQSFEYIYYLSSLLSTQHKGPPIKNEEKLYVPSLDSEEVIGGEMIGGEEIGGEAIGGEMIDGDVMGIDMSDTHGDNISRTKQIIQKGAGHEQLAYSSLSGKKPQPQPEDEEQIEDLSVLSGMTGDGGRGMGVQNAGSIKSNIIKSKVMEMQHERDELLKTTEEVKNMPMKEAQNEVKKKKKILEI